MGNAADLNVTRRVLLLKKMCPESVLRERIGESVVVFFLLFFMSSRP
jgi:hypothetical protein